MLFHFVYRFWYNAWRHVGDVPKEQLVVLEPLPQGWVDRDEDNRDYVAALYVVPEFVSPFAGHPRPEQMPEDWGSPEFVVDCEGELRDTRRLGEENEFVRTGHVVWDLERVCELYPGIATSLWVREVGPDQFVLMPTLLNADLTLRQGDPEALRD